MALQAALRVSSGRAATSVFSRVFSETRTALSGPLRRAAWRGPTASPRSSLLDIQSGDSLKQAEFDIKIVEMFGRWLKYSQRNPA
jgi:hypothetical protein